MDGEVRPSDLLHKSKDGAGPYWPPIERSGKYPVILTHLAHGFEHSQRSIGQRNPMFPPSLHSGARNNPNLILEIDFRPGRVSCFPQPRGSERDELKTPPGRAAVLPKLGHEGADLGIGQCRMMLGLGDLGARRKGVL